MRHRLLTWIGLSVAAFLFVAAGVQYRRAAILREEALGAAQRGVAWLLAYAGPLKDPGIPWIVSAIDAQACHPPRATGFVAQRFTEFDGRDDPVYPALRSLALGNRDAGFPAFAPLWRAQIDKGDVVSAMAYAVYCDRVPRPELVSRTILSTTSAGYELTHQFLALLYMKQNGCLSPNEEKAMAGAAEAIAVEQVQDTTFSDLWAERLALLLYSGHRNLVENGWIEKLIASQEPSGAWSDPKFPRRFYGTPENPHTSALAIWALAEYSGACPFP